MKPNLSTYYAIVGHSQANKILSWEEKLHAHAEQTWRDSEKWRSHSSCIKPLGFKPYSTPPPAPYPTKPCIQSTHWSSWSTPWTPWESSPPRRDTHSRSIRHTASVLIPSSFPSVLMGESSACKGYSSKSASISSFFGPDFQHTRPGTLSDRKSVV